MSGSSSSPLLPPGTPPVNPHPLPVAAAAAAPPPPPAPERRVGFAVANAAQPPPPALAAANARISSVAKPILIALASGTVVVVSALLIGHIITNDLPKEAIIVVLVVSGLVLIRLDLLAKKARDACKARDEAIVEAYEADEKLDHAIEVSQKVAANDPVRGVEMVSISIQPSPQGSATPSRYMPDHQVIVISIERSEPSVSRSRSALRTAASGTASSGGAEADRKSKKVKHPGELIDRVAAEAKLAISNDSTLAEKIAWAKQRIEAALKSNSVEEMDRAIKDIEQLDFNQHSAEVGDMHQKCLEEESKVMVAFGPLSEEYKKLVKDNTLRINAEIERRRAEWEPIKASIAEARDRIARMKIPERVAAYKALTEVERCLSEGNFAQANTKMRDAEAKVKTWAESAVGEAQLRDVLDMNQRLEAYAKQIEVGLKTLVYHAGVPVNPNPALHEHELASVYEALSEAVRDPQEPKAVRSALADAADLYSDLNQRFDRLTNSYKQIRKFLEVERKILEQNPKRTSEDIAALSQARRRTISKPQAAIDMQHAAHVELDNLVKRASRVMEAQFNESSAQVKELFGAIEAAEKVEELDKLSATLNDIDNKLRGLSLVLPEDDAANRKLYSETLEKISQLANVIMKKSLRLATESRNGEQLKKVIAATNEHVSYLLKSYNARKEDFILLDLLRANLEKQLKTASGEEADTLRKDLEQVNQHILIAKDKMDRAQRLHEQASEVQKGINRASKVLTKVLLAQKESFSKEILRIRQALFSANSVNSLQAAREALAKLRSDVDAWMELSPVDGDAVKPLKHDLARLNAQYLRALLNYAVQNKEVTLINEALQAVKQHLRNVEDQVNQLHAQEKFLDASVNELNGTPNEKLLRDVTARLKMTTVELHEAMHDRSLAHQSFDTLVQQAESILKQNAGSGGSGVEALPAASAAAAGGAGVGMGMGVGIGVGRPMASVAIDIDRQAGNALNELRESLKSHPQVMEFIAKKFSEWELQLKARPELSMLKEANEVLLHIPQDLLRAAAKGPDDFALTVAVMRRSLEKYLAGLRFIPELCVAIDAQIAELKRLGSVVAVMNAKMAACQLAMNASQLAPEQRKAKINENFLAMREAIETAPFKEILIQAYHQFFTTVSQALEQLEKR